MNRMILSIGKYGLLNPYFEHLMWMARKSDGGPYDNAIGYGIYFENQLKVIKKISDIDALSNSKDYNGTTFIGFCTNGKDFDEKININNIQPYTSDMISFVTDTKIEEMKGNASSYVFKMVLKGFANAIVNLRQMDFDSLNFLMTDGKYAAAYREVRRDWGKHSLFYKMDDERFTISSVEMHGKWYELEDRTLLIYRDNRLKEYPVKEEIPHIL